MTLPPDLERFVRDVAAERVRPAKELSTGRVVAGDPKTYVLLWALSFFMNGDKEHALQKLKAVQEATDTSTSRAD